MKLINLPDVPKIYYASKDGKIYSKARGKLKELKQWALNGRTRNTGCYLPANGKEKYFLAKYLVLAAYSKENGFNPVWKVGWTKQKFHLKYFYWKFELIDELTTEEFILWSDHLEKIPPEKIPAFNQKFHRWFAKHYYRFYTENIRLQLIKQFFKNEQRKMIQSKGWKGS